MNFHLLSRHLYFPIGLAAITVLTSTTSVKAEKPAARVQPISGTFTTRAAALQTAPATAARSGVAQKRDNTSCQASGDCVAYARNDKSNELANVQRPRSQNSQDSKVAQFPPVDPNAPTRTDSNYVGLGGGIGLVGDTPLGDGGVMVLGRIKLTRTFSVRPAAILGENTSILIPITYDFSLQRGEDILEPSRFNPYVGAGVAIHTAPETTAGVLVSGGVDVPLTPDFTATAGLNASFSDRPNLGLVLGIGYNFGRF